MTKSILDDSKKINKSDYGHVINSIKYLPDQIRQALDEARLIKIPRDYSHTCKVIVSGMGGSNLGAHIIKSVLAGKLKAPVEIIADYDIPSYVDQDTIYIISSYSGTTEEPLSTYREAKRKKAKILAITAQGEKNLLEKLMLKENIPGYIFKPQYNPSNMPRLGVGYSIFGTMTMLAKVGLIKIIVRDMEDIIASMEIRTREMRPEEPERNNQAKQIASKLYGKIPVLVSGGFLAGNMHALRNQINESSKNFATYLVLPDMNHYALEGLICPPLARKNLAFLFFDSKLSNGRIKKRAELTKQVVKKSGIEVVSHKLTGETKLAQAFEVLQLGSWISYYLGVLNKVDTYRIPYVDWFKKALK